MQADDPRSEHREQDFGVGRIVAQISNDQVPAAELAINNGKFIGARAAIKALPKFGEFACKHEIGRIRAPAANDGGGAVLTASYIMGDDARHKQIIDLWERERLCRALIKIKRERAYVPARRDAEILAPEVVIALAALLFQKIRLDDLGIFRNGCLNTQPTLIIARPIKPKLIGAALRRRNHDKSRARAARPHRTQGADEISGKPGCFISNDPAINRQPAHRIIGSGQSDDA